MKQMLQAWEAENPERIASMLTALGNVKPSHLLDDSLFDFDNNQRVANNEAEIDLVNVQTVGVESITRQLQNRPTQ